MAKRYDIIILGGGNAGFGVSAVAHEAGKTIAFVEERDFGGTCPNRGCTTGHDLERGRAPGAGATTLRPTGARSSWTARPSISWGRNWAGTRNFRP